MFWKTGESQTNIRKISCKENALMHDPSLSRDRAWVSLIPWCWGHSWGSFLLSYPPMPCLPLGGIKQKCHVHSDGPSLTAHALCHALAGLMQHDTWVFTPLADVSKGIEPPPLMSNADPAMTSSKRTCMYPPVTRVMVRVCFYNKIPIQV